MWTQGDAVNLCTDIEKIAPIYGAHVALTGGTLYKGGARKDVDIMFYRIRQAKRIDKNGLFVHLNRSLGIELTTSHGWVQKAVISDGANRLKAIDFFFPEEDKISSWQKLKNAFSRKTPYN